jgi:hypothetical protein
MVFTFKVYESKSSSGFLKGKTFLFLFISENGGSTFIPYQISSKLKVEEFNKIGGFGNDGGFGTGGQGNFVLTKISSISPASLSQEIFFYSANIENNVYPEDPLNKFLIEKGYDPIEIGDIVFFNLVYGNPFIVNNSALIKDPDEYILSHGEFNLFTGINIDSYRQGDFFHLGTSVGTISFNTPNKEIKNNNYFWIVLFIWILSVHLGLVASYHIYLRFRP